MSPRDIKTLNENSEFESIQITTWFDEESARIRNEFAERYDSIIPKLPCVNCDKIGHWTSECPEPNKNTGVKLIGSNCCKNMSIYSAEQYTCGLCEGNVCAVCVISSNFDQYFTQNELISMGNLHEFKEVVESCCFSCIVELFLFSAYFCERELQIKVFDFLRLQYNQRKNEFLEFY